MNEINRYQHVEDKPFKFHKKYTRETATHRRESGYCSRDYTRFNFELGVTLYCMVQLFSECLIVTMRRHISGNSPFDWVTEQVKISQ